MKTLGTMLASALLLCCTAACSQQRTYSNGIFGKRIKGSSTYVTKEMRNLDDFTKILITGCPDVVYAQQPGKPKVEIYTSDNLIDLLDIYVKDNTLHVGCKKNVSFSFSKMTIRITSPALDALAITGSCDVLLQNGVQTDNLALSISGSGDIAGTDIRCNSLETSVSGSGDIDLRGIKAAYTKVSVSGSGDIDLEGSTDEADYRISGSGDIDAKGLEARTVTASIAGSGDIKCHAADYLRARIAGSGEIGYKGNPTIDAPRRGLHRLKD